MESNRNSDKLLIQLKEIANKTIGQQRKIANNLQSKPGVIQMVKRSELEAQARQAANQHAARLQASKTGHGRKPHGRDASGKAKRYGSAEAIDRNQQEVWQNIYDQTLNRLLKAHKKDLED
jgi:hypothetical protein